MCVYVSVCNAVYSLENKEETQHLLSVFVPNICANNVLLLYVIIRPDAQESCFSLFFSFFFF